MIIEGGITVPVGEEVDGGSKHSVVLNTDIRMRFYVFENKIVNNFVHEIP